MAVTGHRQRRPRHPEDQRQQRPQRRECGAGADHRLKAPGPGCRHCLGQRRCGRCQSVGTEHSQRTERHRGVHREGDAQCNADRTRDRPGRVPHLLTQGGDSRVAGEGEEQQPGCLQHAGGCSSALPDPGCLGPPRGGHHRNHAGEHREHRGDDHPGEPGGLLDAAVVHRGEADHRRHRDRVGVGRPEVQPDGQCHRGARCRLADDEAPAGQVAPEPAQPFPAVDVGAAGLRILGRQPGRGGRIAVGDHRRDGQAEQQTRTRGGRRRGEDDEHPGADHRPQSDGDRVAGAEAALQGATQRRLRMMFDTR